MLNKHSLLRSITLYTALLSCLVPVFASAYCASCQVPKRPKARTITHIVPTTVPTEQGNKPAQDCCFVCKLPGHATPNKFYRLSFMNRNMIEGKPVGEDRHLFKETVVCSDCIKKTPEKFDLISEEGSDRHYYLLYKQPEENKWDNSFMKKIGFGVMALVAALLCYNTVR